jgi:hypothetical protein
LSGTGWPCAARGEERGEHNGRSAEDEPSWAGMLCPELDVGCP